MYQLEVKYWLVFHQFNPTDQWEVTVDVDAMERARGGQHPADKKPRVLAAESELVSLGVKIGAHPQYGRADVVASHPSLGTSLIEVEGNSSRQKEQALYSALGQTILMMNKETDRYALAVPDEPAWERQVVKIPNDIKEKLRLTCFLVSEKGVRVF